MGSAVLIPIVGFPGAPLGTALSLAVGAWYLTRELGAEFGRPSWSVLEVVRRPAVVALPAAGGLLVLSIAEGGRGIATVALAGSALLVGAAFLWLGVRDGILTREWLGALPVRLRPPATRALRGMRRR